jgi:hypothetical protein
MKKMFLFFMLLPCLGFSQTKNVVSTDRMFPKTDKTAEFEKALAAHSQKFHTGNWKWRVFEIQSGPDAGGFNATEGPNSWTTLDTRGNISKEHNADFDKNVSPLTTDRGSSAYATFNEELSTVQMTDYSDKIILVHTFLKPGQMDKFKEELKKAKAAWTAGNESVAVYEAFASGPPQITLVYRLKNGLKELEKDYRKPMKERYEAANGAGAWDNYLKVYTDCVDHRWSEMMRYRADLSSK